MENRFVSNLWKNIFSITHEQHDKQKAMSELYISGMRDIVDESMRPDCVCCHPKIRYCYEVTSRITGKSLYPIGSVCIEIFNGNNEITRQFHIYENGGLKLFVQSAKQHKDKTFYEVVHEDPDYKGDPTSPTENMTKFIEYRNEVLKEYDREKNRNLKLMKKYFTQWRNPCNSRGECLRSEIPFKCKFKCTFRECNTCKGKFAKFEMDHYLEDCINCYYKNNECKRCKTRLGMYKGFCTSCYDELTYIGYSKCPFKTGSNAGLTWKEISTFESCQKTINWLKKNLDENSKYYIKNLNIIYYLESRQ